MANNSNSNEVFVNPLSTNSDHINVYLIREVMRIKDAIFFRTQSA